MPNHVTNVILASPEVIEGLSREYTAEEIADLEKDYAEAAVRYKERTGNEWPYPKTDTSQRFIDFGVVVPEPDNIYREGCNGQHPHRDENGREMVCWWDWNRQAWGTKWNAYDQSITPQAGDLCEARFDTAWAHPFPVLAALAAKFPDEIIEVAYADEDFGSNCGRYKIKGSELYDEFFPEYGEESRRLAASVKYPDHTLEELEAEWDQDEIDSARHAAFGQRLKKERGGGDDFNAYAVMRDEGLEIPDDIKDDIATKADAEAFWKKEYNR